MTYVIKRNGDGLGSKNHEIENSEFRMIRQVWQDEDYHSHDFQEWLNLKGIENLSEGNGNDLVVREIYFPSEYDFLVYKLKTS